ncbi:hypothetical protein PENSPDRAFT_53446 [Peniophora sp. CONT]|nr:hypothetical protein PENSPDRAFT_53446 [Peniophora sp. CONT]
MGPPCCVFFLICLRCATAYYAAQCKSWPEDGPLKSSDTASGSAFTTVIIGPLHAIMTGSLRKRPSYDAAYASFTCRVLRGGAQDRTRHTRKRRHRTSKLLPAADSRLLRPRAEAVLNKHSNRLIHMNLDDPRFGV